MVISRLTEGITMKNTAYLLCFLASLLWVGCRGDDLAVDSPDPTPEGGQSHEQQAPGFLMLKNSPDYIVDEKIYWINADQYNLEGLSFILGPIQLNVGGPPLHTHKDADEYHVLMNGTATYVLGNTDSTLSMYEATGPFIARIPKGVPHSVGYFVNPDSIENTGALKEINVIGIFPTKHIVRGHNINTGTVSAFTSDGKTLEVELSKYHTAYELFRYLTDNKVKTEKAPLLRPKQ